MRNWIITPLVVGLTCGILLAQDSGRPEQVDQALKERYGEDIRSEIVGTPTEINGVKVFNVEIRDKRGQSTALVTERGDFVLSGMPSQFDKLPQNVQVVRGLFAQEPRRAQSFIADAYEVDLQQRGDQIYRVRLDAVGRLRDITSPQDVQRFETTKFEKAPNDVASKVQEQAEQHIPQGSKVRDVYIDPRHPDFYVVKYEGPGGNEILVIIDQQGNIYQTRTEIVPGELPKHIRDSVNRMFKEDQIKYAYRTQYQFYEFDQQTGGDDRVTFKVRPTGEIMEVQSAEAVREDEAITARFREGARREGDPQPDRRRD